METKNEKLLYKKVSFKPLDKNNKSFFINNKRNLFRLVKKKSKVSQLNFLQLSFHEFRQSTLEEKNLYIYENIFRKSYLFAIITPKKIGIAVERNRCRRRFREALRWFLNSVKTHDGEYNIKRGIYIFYLQKPYYYMQFLEICNTINSVLNTYKINL